MRKKELFRAIEENATFITLGNLKLIKNLTGTFPSEVIFAGGAAKGKLWPQILSDVLGIPVKVPVVKEANALGTAILCWSWCWHIFIYGRNCRRVCTVGANIRTSY